MNSHECAFAVAADHPSLPGHFPGDPIVPGVLVLDQVIHAAESWLARAIQVRSLTQVKFVQPLRPEESARINLMLEGATLKFTVQKDSTMIAQGVMQLAEQA
jgi:3-hydroxyacyl-[acyl-carrier-protein] dehydratase